MVGINRRVKRSGIVVFSFWLVTLVLLSACLFASTPAENESRDNGFYQTITQSSEAVGRVENWNREHHRIERTVKREWKRNDWTSDEDLFARDLVLEVATVPPWDYVKRIQALTNRVSDRYGLGSAESMRFQASIVREFGEFIAGHSDMLLEQSRIQARARATDEPMTPEQAALWSGNNDKLIFEADRRILQTADRLRTLVSPESRDTLERDIEGFLRRVYQSDSGHGAWARGLWGGQEWGLDGTSDAPVTTPSETDQTRASTIITETDLNDHWNPADPATWFAYFLNFTELHKLDASQSGAARSIYIELVGRAGGYLRSHSNELRQVPEEERLTHPAYSFIRASFEELKARLDALLTQFQRSRPRE